MSLMNFIPLENSLCSYRVASHMSEGMAFIVLYTGAWEEVSWKLSPHR